jgi:dihydrofolate reductase
MTGRIYIDLFTTLDGVAQAPGGPDEDRESGFPYGGWQAPLTDEVDGRSIGEGIAVMDALVLGRKTYDIFASYWPDHTGSASDIARKFNEIPKYVASRHPLTLTGRARRSWVRMPSRRSPRCARSTNAST